jgi:hypothetical protein
MGLLVSSSRIQVIDSKMHTLYGKTLSKTLCVKYIEISGGCEMASPWICHKPDFLCPAENRRVAPRPGDIKKLENHLLAFEYRWLSNNRRRDMNKAEVKHLGKPDEVREFPKGRVELIKIGGATVGRATFEPGWRWATSVQPLAKTKSCEAPHFQYHVSGILKVRMDDGTEFECQAGDVSLLPSGHDAWVVGDEPVVMVDFQGMIDYAKSK